MLAPASVVHDNFCISILRGTVSANDPDRIRNCVTQNAKLAALVARTDEILTREKALCDLSKHHAYLAKQRSRLIGAITSELARSSRRIASEQQKLDEYYAELVSARDDLQFSRALATQCLTDESTFDLIFRGDQ